MGLAAYINRIQMVKEQSDCLKLNWGFNNIDSFEG
jgi:hypothetical protein